MENQSPENQPLHRQLRDARRRAGLTQAALAAQAGCMQSAVSMMEGGRMSALARPTLEKIAALLGVALPGEPVVDPVRPAAAMDGAGFCPNPDCPSNLPYLVGGDLLFLPRGGSREGRHCAMCGEVLAFECGACGTAAASGAACCAACGAPLVPSPSTPPADLRTWVAERRRLALALAAWSRPQANN